MNSTDGVLLAQAEEPQTGPDDLGEILAEELQTDVGVAPDADTGMPQLETGDYGPQLVWLAITFIALYLVMSRIALPRVASVVDNRRDRIANDLDTAARLRQETDEVIAAYEQELAEARNKAHRIAAETREKLNAEFAEERARIEAGASVGPFAYLRAGTLLGQNGKIGTFVETKNATIGEGSKVPHLSYVGDATIGTDVNVACGVITVNYDGFAKSHTTIEDGAFVGCDTMLVAPVTIGAGAYTAAGSTIIDDVPADALAIARSRQTTKEGWAARRRAQHERG